MSKRLSITLAVVLVASITSDAAAQWNVTRFDGPANRVYTSIGLDPALITGVGYGRVLPVFGHPLELTGDVGLGVAELDTHDFRARLRALTSLLHWRSIHLTGAVMSIFRGTENSIYRGLNFGVDITATLGAYRPGWFAAVELGVDKAVVTHLTHRDWYRRYHYPDARDGWYVDAGGTFHYGLSSGFAVGRAEVFGRAGGLRTEELNELVPPFYVVLGIGFAF